MALRAYTIPNFDGNEIDVVGLDPTQSGPNSPGLAHYAYTVAAREAVLSRRAFEWFSMQNLTSDAYAARHAETIRRLQEEDPYRPGELALSLATVDYESQLSTTMRLGALELLANIHAGRLTATDKDPFPHQLALQQFMRRPNTQGSARILVADEVGLGKTIEVGLVLRDILIARGALDQFSCLYLTSGGLKEDAAEKLKSVMQGALDDRNIVDTVDSFRGYGRVDISGIHVGSMHAARQYITPAKKRSLHQDNEVAPDILVIDECHHAGSRESLEGHQDVSASNATQTYKAVWQMINGTYWERSRPPSLVIFMSATPFRSREQFLNLLRLLTDGLEVDGQAFDAYGPMASAANLGRIVKTPEVPVHIVWRRQDDAEVHSWSGGRLFPRLDIIRPHRVEPDEDVALGKPTAEFLGLIDVAKDTMSEVHRAHDAVFRGFAQFQLEKKLTSSSVAAACWLFAWTVRHLSWRTQQEFVADKSQGTKNLRELIGSISRALAQYNASVGAPAHVDVEFVSEGYTFEAVRVARSQNVPLIYDFNRQIRDRDDEETFILDDDEVVSLCALAKEILGTDGVDATSSATAENLKIDWLRSMLARHPSAKFLVFTDNLQTCAVLQSAFGTTARLLTGSMDTAARRRAVADLGFGRGNARILVATSAADEGFDLQVADRVVHWDISGSPAVLMQRNGRVARLGQRFDVRAYYLILEGTHEERRDTRLQETFGDLGIDDENLRNRILGSLEDDELERLEEAVRNSDGGVLGGILSTAAEDNHRMEEELAELSEALEATAVLDRMDLCERMITWQALGLPDTSVDYEIRAEEWVRPVFAERATTEIAIAQRARLQRDRYRKEVVFDPEFIVFGEDTDSVSLAGLRPWTRGENDRGRCKIRPDERVDILGDLLCKLSRLPGADFARIDRRGVQFVTPDLAESEFLLFCSHPILEDETEMTDIERPYLNCYGFSVDGEGSRCTNPEGVSAGDVRALIKELERQGALSANLPAVSPEEKVAYLKVSEAAAEWLGEVTRFGATTFLGPQQYFVPIPIALVAVEDKLLDEQ